MLLISLVTRPIRSTTQIWVVTRNQYGISANGAQTSFGGKPVDAPWNVGCFLDYQYTLHTNFFSLCRNLKNVLFKLSVGTKICVFAPTLYQFQRQSWRKSISPKNGIISRKAKYACLQAITSMKFGHYGKSTFRWNAIVSSWHSNELKTARLSIPYYHSPFTPPRPSSSRDETSRALVFFVRFTPTCFPESLFSHSSLAPGNGKKEILVLQSTLS